MAVPGGAVAERGSGRVPGWVSGRRTPAPFDLRKTLHRAWPAVVFALLLLAAWQLYVAISGVSDADLPSPTEIASAFWRYRGLILSNGGTTIVEILIGYAVAVLLGVAWAILATSSSLAERALYPWLVISQTVPIPAIAPIFVIWTGFDIRPKIMVIALTTFFPVTVNTIDGLKAADPELLNLLRTLGAGRWRRFRVAQFPAALPFVFSGLKVAAALAVIGAVFAEWVGSSSGLGYLILIFNQQTATADMFACVVALSVIGILLFSAVVLLERLTLPWYHDIRRDHRETVAGAQR